MMFDNDSFRRNEDVNVVVIGVGKRELNALELVAWNNVNSLLIDFMAVGSECPAAPVSALKDFIPISIDPLPKSSYRSCFAIRPLRDKQ